MADYRRTRDYQPDAPLELQYLNDPSYTPLDQIGGQGMGGAGNEGSFNSPAAGGIENSVDAIQREHDLQRGLLGQMASLRQQGQSGGGMDLGGMWEGLKGAGSQGLDMLGRGLNAITPSQDTVNNIAMRLQNAHAIGTGQTPLYMMQQQHQMAMGQHQELMAQRRQQMAMQLGQLQEQRRGHDLQLLEKALASPRASALLEQLGQDPNYGMAQQAAMLHKGLKDSDYGSFSAYREFIPEEVQQRFMQGQLPQHELTAWIDEARLSAKEDAKFKAKDAILTRAMNKPAEQRTPREMQLVEEHQAELELKKLKPQKMQSEIDENNAQAAKFNKDAETGSKPDRSNMNRVSVALTGQSFDDLPPGGPAQQMVLDHYSRLYAQGRQEVQQATPAPVKERSDVVDRKSFLQSGAMSRPQAGITNAQLSKGDYIQMSDTQQKQAADVDKAGANLKQLFGIVMPMIKAKTPTEAAMQYAKLHAGAFAGQNPDAATFKAGSEAFSSQLARVFGGEVGVMTNQDITRWQNTLPTFGDTKQVAERKQKLFFEIYENAVQAFRNQIAGERGSTDKLQGLLKQADNFKSTDPQGEQGQAAQPNQAGPFQDPDKEKRYQEWKRKQGK
jgi:hypothetical protein